MTPPPRRLRFAVGSSLVCASLSLGATGCDDSQPTVNPAPEKSGKQPDDGKPNDATKDPEPKPEPLRINEGPQPEPKEPEPEPEPEVKRVNPVPPAE